MAGTLTTYTCNEVMDHIFENGAYTPTSTVELALWVGSPTITGAGGTEASYTNYQRQTISFAAATSRAIDGFNGGSSIDFPQCGATGTTGITHWAVCEASSGNVLAFGDLSSSVDVVEGNTPSIASGQVDIGFNSNEMSTYLAHKILDFVFRNQTFTAPGLFIALSTSTLAVTDTTLTGKEVANSNNYTRLDFGDYSNASSGAVTSNTDAQWTGGTAPSGSWGTVVACAIMDSGTHNGGNMLWFDNGIVDQAIGNGDTVKFAAGDIDVSLA